MTSKMERFKAWATALDHVATGKPDLFPYTWQSPIELVCIFKAQRAQELLGNAISFHFFALPRCKSRSQNLRTLFSPSWDSNQSTGNLEAPPLLHPWLPRDHSPDSPRAPRPRLLRTRSSRCDSGLYSMLSFDRDSREADSRCRAHAWQGWAALLWWLRLRRLSWA